jgi:tripartite-type tricarboxylate transporter receptor subunit TctC
MKRSMQGTKKFRLRFVGMLLVFTVMFPFFSAVAATDSYPNKPIKMIIPNTPGGANGIIANFFSAKLTEFLGQKVVEEYQGGAAGVIGTEMVAHAKPDGYTLLCTSNQIALAPLYEKVPYDPVKSFVTRMVEQYLVLSVHPNVPVNSVKELIALAKKEPGKLNLAGTGAGSNMHLSAELLMKKAGIKFNLLQFKGGSPAMIDVMSGHSQVGFNTLSTSLPNMKSGKLKALGYSGRERTKLFPDLPTISEAGVPGYVASQWVGLFAPAGTSKEVAGKLYNALEKILSNEDNQTMLIETVGAHASLLGPDKFPAFIVEDMDEKATIIKEANIRI